MDDEVNLNIIHSFFKGDSQRLVRHHIDSFNDFYSSGIFKTFRYKNPIRIQSKYDPNLARYDASTGKTNPELGFGEYRSQALIYMGGKDGSRVYFGKPVIYDEGRAHYMYPNEARLRNMTYAMTIHYDVEIEFIDILEDGELPKAVAPSGVRLSMDSDSEEDEEYENFKANSGKGIDKEGGEGGEGREANEDDMEEFTGGAKGSVKKPFKKPKISKNAITPKETGEMRELTEKSMISKNVQKTMSVIEKIYLGRFPIMLQSDFCILGGLSPDLRFQMGECRNDYGGYFIIDGKEKVLVAQEKFADNLIDVTKDISEEAEHLATASIRSVSENVSKPVRTLTVKIVAPNKKFSNGNIVVNVPNVRKPVPLFILFRALGIISDKDIITLCLYDLNKNSDMLETFVPSVHESGGIMTQKAAIEFIAVLTKGKTTETVLEILADYFLPHIGEMNFIQKAYYLGYIVNKLVSVHLDIEQPTNRDSYKLKRIETPGAIIGDLFKEAYNLQQKYIHLWYEKVLFFNQDMYENNLPSLINDHKEFFNNRLVEQWFKKGFKGNWGTQAHTKRIGVLQDMNRLSQASMLSHFRKTNIPIDSSTKIVGPRLLHASQYGFFDPIDTDGSSIGLQKQLGISIAITKGISREPIVDWLRKKARLQYVEECPPVLLSQYTKVFVNGYWAGCVEDPYHCVNYVKIFRRNGLLPLHMSILFDIRQNTIQIYCDEGRLTRPVIYKSEKGFFFENPGGIKKKIEDNDFTWMDLVSGFNEKAEGYDPSKIYELHELYPEVGSETNPMKMEKFIQSKAIVEYLDTSEIEGVYIALKEENLTPQHTHLEIHSSFVLGLMCNLIPFPQNNPAVRNSFSCGQSRQAVSVYHTNHQVRMDKAAVVLNNPQIPLVKTRFMEHINGEENCYGVNAIVAIMVYSGYNMEDAVLINETAIQRGMFSTTYYTTYETHEEKVVGADGKAETEKLFSNIEKTPNIIGTKPGYEYQHLDDYGLVKEGTEVHDKMVVIGMSTMVDQKTGLRKDDSKTPKKGQLGLVDRSFITEGEEGQRIAKVRVREMRFPAIGDKMASRAGQKGTVGLVIPAADMPFTSSGIIPDIIVNPHAIPSRMTIGQFVECITGKACALTGNFGDATAFQASGVSQYADILTAHKFHSSGNEILYNGMTGGQVEVEIFMGPTYYMRLKHMVKDKINYRPQGPRTALTRQPVSGRANDGGLRIGEMERDGLISHGATNVLTESMMERSDKYFMAVCNKTGLIAVYNPDKNLFLSPMADGPLKFVGSLAENNLAVENISKHGRSFSVVRIPYSLKLMIQELQTINVAMRLITDDNIEQIENMSFSKNMNILLDKKGEISMKEYTMGLQNIINKQGDIKVPVSEKEEVNMPRTPDHPPRSPPGPPPGSPAYAPGTPPYSPDYALGSPAYAPGTPPYSPDYAPGSPAYLPRTPEDSPMDDLFSTPLLSKKSSSGGNNENMRQYSIGELASLNSYQGPDNLWQITDLGDEFITVKKSGGNNDIQIVEPFDLSPPQAQRTFIPDSSPQMALPMVPQMVGGSQEKPSTNIFLINGNNNEVDGAAAMKTNGSVGTSNGVNNNNVNNNSVNNANNDNTSKNNKNEETPPAAPEKEFSIFDTMTNFLVRKV
jgi:DNA-directed RNA polymerase II subunit RPB2